ncbi:ABC transporter ATP-binding protein [Burkholderia cepacia]|uniref:ABC transporter ATP-binding protein n=2 Tax=Burkholderia cepacia complex TaxID=87882 RepID=A0A1B4PPT9_BURCE|nr:MULTISPECIES: ABC transporter ATP-binding protein [Burkholderia cepacia complex]AOK15895.1 ABC transporter ATP-binding protein [Burkholderia cepacia]AOK22621.1 ABC transporter ATP-binding protein [Burkholderia ubonensis]
MSELAVNEITVDLPVFEVHGRSLRKHLSAFGKGNRLAESNDGVVIVRALENVSFRLQKGDRLGLIGANGAGKSTLLRVLAGIYKPAKGAVVRTGKTVPLLDITLGLDENSTGRQNIRLRGLFLGQTRAWVEENERDICEFSELGDYLDMPVRTYSSGMRMRLAFAISMAVHADILLLDEVMGVGDSAFQDKAKSRVRQVSDRAGVVVMALHSSPTIMEMCNKALWLDKGHVRMLGDSHEVVRAYDDFMHGRSAS